MNTVFEKLGSSKSKNTKMIQFDAKIKSKALEIENSLRILDLINNFY